MWPRPRTWVMRSTSERIRSTGSQGAAHGAPDQGDDQQQEQDRSRRQQQRGGADAVGLHPQRRRHDDDVCRAGGPGPLARRSRTVPDLSRQTCHLCGESLSGRRRQRVRRVVAPAGSDAATTRPLLSTSCSKAPARHLRIARAAGSSPESMAETMSFAWSWCRALGRRVQDPVQGHGIPRDTHGDRDGDRRGGEGQHPALQRPPFPPLTMPPFSILIALSLPGPRGRPRGARVGGTGRLGPRARSDAHVLGLASDRFKGLVATGDSEVDDDRKDAARKRALVRVAPRPSPPSARGWTDSHRCEAPKGRVRM